MDVPNRSLEYDRLIVLGLSMGMILNLVPRSVVLPAVVAALLLLIAKRGLPAILAALVLFGHAFFALIKYDLGLGTTHCFIGITLAVLLGLLIMRRPPSVSYNERAMPNCLVWVGMVYLVIVLGYFLGPKTGHSLYAIQLFLVYASFCILSALLVARSGTGIPDLVLPSILLWSCSFPLMGFSLFQVPSHLSSAYLGLRGVEGFATIGQGRLSGLMLTMIILHFVILPRKNKSLPEVIIGAAISAPLLWYSLSRQALAATFITVVVIIILAAFRRNLVRRYYQRVLILSLTAVIFFGAIIWAAGRVEITRMSESGLLGGKTGGSRYEIWRRSLQYIEENPLIGYGLGSFSAFSLGYAGGGLPDWPHNWFIEAWLEHGLPGLILFIIGTGILLRPLVIDADVQITSWAILGLYWFVVIQLSGDIPRNALIFFFITIVALTRVNSPVRDPVVVPEGNIVQRGRIT